MQSTTTTTAATTTAAAAAVALHLANVPGGRYTLALHRHHLLLPGSQWVAVAYTLAHGAPWLGWGQGAPVQRVALYNTATGAVRTVPAIAWAPAGLPAGTATLWAEVVGA